MQKALKQLDASEKEIAAIARKSKGGAIAGAKKRKSRTKAKKN